MQTLQQKIDFILSKQIVVTFPNLVNGFWDGGAKSRFVFSPKLCRYQGSNLPNIEWGSWGANLWFRQEIGATAQTHLAQIVRKLYKGKSERKIEIVERKS